jgi:hypothetical protein
MPGTRSSERKHSTRIKISSLRSLRGGTSTGVEFAPIEQVLAEGPTGCGGFQITLRGSDDANVDTEGLHSPDSLEFPFLEHLSRVQPGCRAGVRPLHLRKVFRRRPCRPAGPFRVGRRAETDLEWAAETNLLWNLSGLVKVANRIETAQTFDRSSNPKYSDHTSERGSGHHGQFRGSVAAGSADHDLTNHKAGVVLCDLRSSDRRTEVIGSRLHRAR